VDTDQGTPTGLGELNGCRDLAWPTIEDQEENDMVTMNKAVLPLEFDGKIRVDENVFLSGGQPIGRIMKLLPGEEGQISYLIVRTSRFWDRHKIIPVALVRDAKPKGVWLTIDQDKFQELQDYKTDLSIANDVSSALWNDDGLRATDYHEVDVRVEDGVVSLAGHISGKINQDRIESAVGSVKGILGVKVYLVADDKLLIKVAEALIPIERVEGNRIFTKVENGVVALSGQVNNPADRTSAGQYAANVPWVRGVVNNISAPGIDLTAEDQRFLQPTIGEKIYFLDSLYGLVTQVIINPHNRRVVSFIIQGRFPNQQLKSGFMKSVETMTPDRLAVIPISVIRYLTSDSGFLLINSTETTRYQDFNPASFVAPASDWEPPFPYSSENVMFFAQI
jgi:osmotically-inducible protein OsmY